jgi:hypothetical protein
MKLRNSPPLVVVIFLTVLPEKIITFSSQNSRAEYMKSVGPFGGFPKPPSKGGFFA